MASFSNKSFERKLKEMSARQDSVQTVSLWVIHHRAHSKAVVNVWQEHVKKAKPERRLILFYLANDVIQNSRKKGKEFSTSFGKVLSETMSYLRDSQIRPSVERVLKIWQERKVFEKSVVQKLVAQLYQEAPNTEVKVKAKTSEKKAAAAQPKRPVPADFKVSTVIGAIVKMQEHEAETQIRENKVSQLRLDASSSDGIKQLKDYAGGNRFSTEFEESSIKIDELVESLESENHHRHALINALENSESFYEAALKEATIIANAYRQFGNRLHAMKKKLDNKIRKFATAEKEAPVSAPKASFLASGLSGILEEVNKSPAGSPKPVEQEEKKEEKKSKAEEKEIVKEPEIVTDPTVDHVEVADMDIESDSEDEASDSAEPQETTDTNSNANDSSVSTPNVTPAATVSQSPCPNKEAEKPPPSATQQFGYTITADSTDHLGGVSPASRDSAPSPEGSPELNLEQYEEKSEEPATSVVSTADMNIIANKSFAPDSSETRTLLGNTEPADELSGAVQSGSESGTDTSNQALHPVNLIAQLISKTRRQNVSSGENSPQSASQGSLDKKPPEKPLLSLIDSLFPVLTTSLRSLQSGSESDSRENEKQKELEKEEFTGDQDHDTPASDHEPANSDFDKHLSNSTSCPSDNPAVPQTVGPDANRMSNETVPANEILDEETPEGDNTPEHGAETATEFAPIIIRSGSEFLQYPNVSPLQDRCGAMRREFSTEHSPPRGLNPISFSDHEVRRAPIAQLDERLPQGIIPPGIRSPPMGAPRDWKRRPSHDEFGIRDRGDNVYDNGPADRRNPYVPMDPRRNIPINRRDLFHPPDLRPPLHRKPERDLHTPEDFAIRERRDLSPGSREAHFLERRLNISSREALEEPLLIDGEQDNFHNFPELERINHFPPVLRPVERDERVIDRRPELHFADRQENHHVIERRDGFRDIRPTIRGGHLPIQRAPYRPRPFRDDHPQEFRPRFMRPLMRHMGREFPDMRLKRPGPPFPHDPAKRPHF